MAASDSGGGQGSVGSGVGRSTPTPQRRRSLRAVFAADIAGFSGRMSLNETNTVNALSEIRVVGRRELEKYDGWLFGMPGDGLFATFESAVNAVQCALEVQLDLANRPHLQETPLRIGIHLGEVIIEDDLPYGETLNIAARLESLADPGGILVSGTVMDAVSARVSATFEDRGVPILKNIPRRIPTYAVKPPPARSPTDQTQSGLSNLDRTTRLDRDAIRQILEGHVDAGRQVSGAGSPPPVGAAPAVPPVDAPAPANIPDPGPVPSASPAPPAARTTSPVDQPRPADPPVSINEAAAPQSPNAMPMAEGERPPPPVAPPPEPEPTAAPLHPMAGMLDTTVPLLPADPDPLEPPPPAPSENTTEASAPIEPQTDASALRRPTLSEKLAQLPTPVAEEPDLATPAVTSNEPLAPLIAESPLEKTLPPATPVPSAPAEGRATPPSIAFLDEITKALAVHVGPFAKLIVNREMKTNPNVFELISKLEEHIPNDDERLVFRVRASHINEK
ncbi:MAG: hypothetical protein JXQ99_12020 [Hyphomicrobiaceae bacterium]